MNRPAVKRMPALLLLALLLVPSACDRGERGVPPPSGREEIADDNAAPAAAPEWLPPVVATDNAASLIAVPDNTAGAGTASGHAAPGIAAPDNTAGGAVASGDTEAAAQAPGPPPDDAAGSVAPPAPRTNSVATSHTDGTHSARRPHPAAAPHPAPPPAPPKGAPASLPGWARSPEELVYRVDFIGITMGYARFRYSGKVSIAGKPAYHLNVRAWTSGILSYIFPINETIDYYLDAETLAPIRQEFTLREREKDDVALYDQDTGKITYRYRQSGKIRKQVDTIPSVYDPVSVAYYFRWRDLGAEGRPRNVYAGRKIYQISARVLGNERIRTEHGEVDTIAVLPLIRRDGKPDDKGDLKIWFSNDEKRVPVRLYAKFRKIKEWTLVGELMPPAAKAGG